MLKLPWALFFLTWFNKKAKYCRLDEKETSMAMSITWWSLVNSPWSRDLGGAVLVGRRLWRRRPWLGWLMLPLETPLGHISGSIRQSTTTPALHPDKHLPAPPILTIICSSPVMREVEVIVMMGMRVLQSCQTRGWSQDVPIGLLAGHVPIHLCSRPTPQYAGDGVIFSQWQTSF